MKKDPEFYWLTQFEPNVQIVIIIAIAVVVSVAIYSFYSFLKSMG
jgi:hypothetical protein